MTNEAILEIRFAEREDINTIGYLAHEIWPQAYADILTSEQLSYMLDLLYKPTSLSRQMNQQHIFLIAELDEEPSGFASFSEMEPGLFKLHKLYVLPGLHGKGVGRALLDFVTAECVSRGGTTLLLNVNRHNKAINFYKKNGFRIIREEDVDIGNGYYMNDYVMSKAIGTPSSISL